MSAQWSGFLYDGRAEDRIPVTVALGPTGLRVTRGDGATEVWPIADVRHSQTSFSDRMVKLEYGSDPIQALFVEQPGFADAMRSAFPTAVKPVQRNLLTSRGVIVGLGGAAAVLFALLLGANAGADWLARRAPTSWEISLGEDVALRFAPPSQRCTDSAGLAAVRGVLDRLVAAAPPSPYTFRLVVLRDSSINAFAAPGGFVAVNSGLLRAAKTPEELAGVLAHEAQHVLHRHSTRAIAREAPLRIGLALLFGGTGAEGIAGIIGSLGALSYRRGDESEADRDGIRLMQAARIEDDGMVSFMRTLAATNAAAPRFTAYLSSHPHSDRRVEELDRLRQQGETTTPLMDDATWARVKAMCQ
jgi:Zn-dependent protease with chaperone function